MTWTGTKKDRDTDRDRETKGQEHRQGQGNKRTGTKVNRYTQRQDTGRQGKGNSWTWRGMGITDGQEEGQVHSQTGRGLWTLTWPNSRDYLNY